MKPASGSGLQLASAPAAPGSAPKAKKAPALRIPAFDFTKGALVLIMVLYHWLNYFISTQGYWYRYLRFLTPSFIFITGFLISQVYLSRDVSDPRIFRRLVERGAKILGIFTFLNVWIGLLDPSAGRLPFHSFSMDTLKAIYLTGNLGAGKTAPFSVLVPIGYLLILAAFLIVGYRFHRYAFPAACGAFFAAILLLGWSGLGSGNLELLAIGLLGASLGYLPIGRVNSFLAGHTLWLILGYAGYVAAITLWNEIYPLQVVGVCLSVMLLYRLGMREPGWAGRMVVLLGKYSLVGYIVQIAVLQVLRRGMRPVTDGLGAWGLGISFAAAVVLIVSAVLALDRMRAASLMVNKAYNAVFS